jgi:hypothetical protein
MNTSSGPTGTDVPEMDCIDFLSLVNDLLEIDDGEWEAAVVRHLHDCPPCRIFLEQLIDLRRLLRGQHAQSRLSLSDPRITMLYEHAASALGELP